MLYITLRQYEYIVAVADTGSLTDAAALLNVSQPSMSVAITRVEARLGEAIFVRRKGAAIQITPFGYRIVEQARALLQAAITLEQSRNAARPIVLGCFEDIAPWYLPKILMDLRSRFPAMTFQSFEGRFADLATGITEGRIDVAISYDIGFGRDIEHGFERRKVTDASPVVFVSAAHPFAELPFIELHQLTGEPLILSTDELSFGYIRRLFETLDIVPNVAHQAASLEMMRALSAHGAGVGISYSNPPTNLSYDGQPLVTVPIQTPEASADIMLVWANLAERDPEVMTVLEAIRWPV